jgi:hypothetical protein
MMAARKNQAVPGDTQSSTASGCSVARLGEQRATAFEGAESPTGGEFFIIPRIHHVNRRL